jgi:hypothetical protein
MYLSFNSLCCLQGTWSTKRSVSGWPKYQVIAAFMAKLSHAARICRNEDGSTLKPKAVSTGHILLRLFGFRNSLKSGQKMYGIKMATHFCCRYNWLRVKIVRGIMVRRFLSLHSTLRWFQIRWKVKRQNCNLESQFHAICVWNFGVLFTVKNICSSCLVFALTPFGNYISSIFVYPYGCF